MAYRTKYDIDRLLAAAAERQLTQRDLAIKAGVHPLTVSRLARGHHSPTAATIRRLARVVGLKAQALVLGTIQQ